MTSVAEQRGRMTVMGAFAALIVLLVALGQAASLHYLFPAMAFVIGAWLFSSRPIDYVIFSLLLWIVTPGIRRLVDFAAGWHAFSPVMLTPLLVASLAGITVVSHAGALSRRRCFPFVLCLAATGYGLASGLIQNSVSAALYQFANWVVPILFALHIAIAWRPEDNGFHRVLGAMVWGMSLAGVYGVLQFLLLPGWDAFWMENADIDSVGAPLPTLFRVFSTMNSPGPFSIFCMAALLIVVSSLNRWWIVASVPIFVSFVLTLVRSSWTGFAFGLAALLVHSSAGQRARLVALLIAVTCASLPFLAIPAIVDAVNPRLATFVNVKDDESYQARRNFYGTFLARAVSNVPGEGFGSTGLATKFDNGGLLGEFGNFDSGIMEVFYVLGWPGTVLFLWGSLWLVSSAFREASKSEQTKAAASVAVAIGVQMIGSNTVAGASGILFWTMLAITAVAARRGQRMSPSRILARQLA